MGKATTSTERIDTKNTMLAKTGKKEFVAREKDLQEKLANNEEKYTSLLGIFTSIKEEKIFTQEEISNYIENTNMNLLYRQIHKIHEDPKKILIESMDMFLGKTIDAETIQEKEKQGLENNKTTKEEIKELKTEIKDINIEIKDISIEIKDIKIDIKETENKQENLIKSRKATQDSYDKLDDKDKISNEVVQKQKKTIPDTLIDAINKKLQGTTFTTDDFLKFYLIGENKENKDKAEYKDFMKNYRELKKQLEIPESIPDIIPLSTTMNPKNTDDLIDNNKNLQDFIQKPDKREHISPPTMPIYKDFDKEFFLYTKFITDEKIKQDIKTNKSLIKKYITGMDTHQENTADKEGKKAYEVYIDITSKIKEDIAITTQTIIKKRALGSCITGLAKYFDTTRLIPSGLGMNNENFADDFDINTQTGFQIQKGENINEKNDDIFYIDGKIHNNSIGFSYNLSNPDAQLQSDDFLHFNQINETFSVGEKNKGKNNLGIKLPTLDNLTSQAQDISEKYFTSFLEKATSKEAFEIALKEKISFNLLKNYSQEVLIKTRVERDIEKNITAQTLQNTFLPETLLSELHSDKKIDTITETIPRKIIKIRDKSTENMRSDELRTLKSLIERLDPHIKKIKHEQLSPRRKKLFEGVEEERSAISYTQERGIQILNFFQKFSKNNKINLQDLEVFISTLEKKENITQNISKFSPDFITKEENDDADNLIEDIK